MSKSNLDLGKPFGLNGYMCQNQVSCRRFLLAVCFMSVVARAQEITWPGDNWPRATPESQGMSSALLKAAPGKTKAPLTK
jgi:hypothetical protein